MNEIKLIFDQWFENWGITLPEQDLKQRKAGEIMEAGFFIQYLFGRNEKGEYMDVYTYHRMTNDRHKRIYETGEEKGLPTMMESFTYDPKVPGDKEQAEKVYFEYNRKVSEELKQKGFRD